MTVYDPHYGLRRLNNMTNSSSSKIYISRKSVDVTVEKRGNVLHVKLDGDGWGAFEIKDSCPAKDLKFKIVLPYKIYQQLYYATRKMDPYEWSAILEAEIDTDKLIIKVKDFGVPKQKVSHASTTFEGIVLPDDGILAGHFHSHPFTKSGKPSFSGQDEASPLADLPFAVLMGGNGEMIGKVRLMLPCGGIMKLDADVEVEDPTVDIEEEKLNKMLEENIQREVPVVRTPTITYSSRRAYDPTRSTFRSTGQQIPVMAEEDIEPFVGGYVIDSGEWDVSEIVALDDWETDGYTYASIFTFPIDFRDRHSEELDKDPQYKDKPLGTLVKINGSEYVKTSVGWLNCDEVTAEDLIIAAYYYKEYRDDPAFGYAVLDVSQVWDNIETIMRIHMHGGEVLAIAISTLDVENGQYTFYVPEDDKGRSVPEIDKAIDYVATQESNVPVYKQKSKPAKGGEWDD